MNRVREDLTQGFICLGEAELNELSSWDHYIKLLALQDSYSDLVAHCLTGTEIIDEAPRFIEFKMRVLNDLFSTSGIQLPVPPGLAASLRKKFSTIKNFEPVQLKRRRPGCGLKDY